MTLPLDSASVIGAIAKLTEKIIQLDQRGLLTESNSGFFEMDTNVLKFSTFDERKVRKFYIKADALSYFRTFVVTPIIREIAIPSERSYWIRKVSYQQKQRVLKSSLYGCTWVMHSSWELVDIASAKNLQSLSSSVSGFNFSSYSDVEFYVEVKDGDVEKLKKDQIERNDTVYEQLHQNLFSFTFTVQRPFEKLAVPAEVTAYIPINQEYADFLHYQNQSTTKTLWSRPGFLLTEVETIPLRVARELSRPFFWHLYHRVARRKIRSYVFLVRCLSRMLRCV
jgi:hypothetical protein